MQKFLGTSNEPNKVFLQTYMHKFPTDFLRTRNIVLMSLLQTYCELFKKTFMNFLQTSCRLLMNFLRSYYELPMKVQ
jgi:hypothetical protein